jgi:hypothetical protein
MTPRRLYHFSEDPGIRLFRPHVAATALRQDEARVWAVDEGHAPGFWFPRQCPRACCWLSKGQRAEDFPSLIAAGDRRMQAIQADLLARMKACELTCYTFDAGPFVLENTDAGHWVAHEDIAPIGVAPVGDLLERHRQARIELRVVADLRPLIAEIVASGLGFSIYRKRNLALEPL